MRLQRLRDCDNDQYLFYQKEQQSTGGDCRNSGALAMAPAQQAVIAK